MADAIAQCGADILVQCLVNHGVDVFAYQGGASMLILSLHCI